MQNDMSVASYVATRKDMGLECFIREYLKLARDITQVTQIQHKQDFKIDQSHLFEEVFRG